MENGNVIFQVKKLGFVLNTKWSVFVDGKFVGQINFKNSLKLKIPKGLHNVQYKVGLQKTKQLEINVTDEDVIVECFYDGTVNNFYVVGENQMNSTIITNTNYTGNNSQSMDNANTVNSTTQGSSVQYNNKKTMDIKWIIEVVGLIVAIVAVIWGWNMLSSGGLNFNSGGDQEKYLSTAVEKLKSSNINTEPIEKIVDGNKIIYYGDDILVQISYKTSSLTSSVGNFDTAMYSINEKRFINKTELSNMKYDDKWKNAKVENIDYNIVTKINNKYFK